MIELIKSTFYHEEETKSALIEFIKAAKFLSMGQQCRQFEAKFAQKQNRKNAVYVSSGSMANLVLIQSLVNLGRLKKGDRIGVSALTWATNIMPVIQLGLEPVLIDCEIDTLNVSPETLKPHLDKIDALFITNVLGLSDEISVISQLCKKHKIILIEDNCESLGSRTAGTLLGNFGVASTFSFFVGHHLSTIEGGMICTDDDELHAMLVMVRAHGWDRNLSANRQELLRKKYKTNDFYAKYLFYELAYNARPTEIGGFIGSFQIEYWDEIVEKRERNFLDVKSVVDGNDDFYTFRVDHMDVISSFALPFICKNKNLRNHYLARFSGIAETRPVIAGDMFLQPFYKQFTSGKSRLKNASFIHENGFYIGNNPEMTKIEIETIKSLCRKKADVGPALTEEKEISKK